MKAISAILILLGLGVFAASTFVDATVPSVINYQGSLSDAAGAPLEGKYVLTFAIYSDNLGGEPIWSETTTVTVVDGLFDVLLGSSRPLTPEVFASQGRFLGISVNGGEELTPRHRFGAVGYSYRVGTVDQAAGGTVSGNLSVSGDVNVGGILKTPSGVTLESQGDTLRVVSGASQIIIRPNGIIEMQSNTVKVVSSGNLDLQGRNVNITSSEQLNMNAGSSANLIGGSVKVQASGTADIDGGLVTIN